MVHCENDLVFCVEEIEEVGSNQACVSGHVERKSIELVMISNGLKLDVMLALCILNTVIMVSALLVKILCSLSTPAGKAGHCIQFCSSYHGFQECVPLGSYN
jgi:hypothetical protein